MARYSVVKINPSRFEKGQIKFYLFILPVLLFMLLPLVFIIFNAFKPLDEMYVYPPRFIPRRPTLENFELMWKMASFSRMPVSVYFFNSVITTITSVFLTILLSVCGGYVISKKHFKGKNLIFKINTISLMFVAAAVKIPRYLIIEKIGLLDNFWVHILPGLAMPVGLFLIKQFIDQLPDSLIEAAYIDGGSDYYILWKIITPLIKSPIATVAILAFQGAWNLADASKLYIESENLKNFAYYMSTFTTIDNNNVAGQGLAAAGALIMLLPNLILFIILQSKVMNAMTHSGIK